MNIILSPNAEKLVQERVQRGEYRSVTELVERAIYQLLDPKTHSEEPVIPAIQEQNGPLKPLILLEGSLPSNWKDDIY